MSNSNFIYVHYEAVPAYALTGKITVDPSDTVNGVIIKVDKLLRDRKVLQTSSATTLRLTDCSGRTVGPLVELFSQAILDASSNDYFVTIEEVVSPPLPLPPPSASASKSSSTIAGTTTSSTSTHNTASAKTIATRPSSSGEDVLDLSDLSASKKKLEDFMAKRMFRNARILSEEISKIVSTQKNNGELMSMVLHAQSRIHFENERFDKALELAERAVQLVKRQAGNKSSALSMALLFLHGAKCNFKEGNYEECDSLVNDFFSALGGIANALKGENNELACEGLAVKAESVFAQGKANIAANIVNEVLAGDKGGVSESKPGDVPLLQAYAYFAYRYDKISDALRALLRAIVIDQSNKKTVKLLADVLKSNNVIEEIAQQIPMKAPQAPAYSFLSTIAKDHGAIGTSNDLLAAAWRMVPSNCNYVLNLVHNFELTFEYDRALDVAVQFLKENSKRSVGSVSTGAGDRFTCGDFAMVCERYLGSSGFDQESDDLFLEWFKGGENSTAAADDNDLNKDYVVCHNIREIAFVKNDNSGKIEFQRRVEIEDNFLGSSSEALGNHDLDLIALLMTVIKIFFLQGKLNALPQCFLMAEKARRCSNVSLHTTSIRNENAYYMCIAQMMTERVKMIAETLSESDRHSAVQTTYQSPYSSGYRFKGSIEKGQTVFVVGDSHVLPLSWATFKDKEGNDVVMIPRLVTGVKHFHCRANNEFYTKTGLINAIKGIPDKSKVMFVLGEIDCREGILRAVERDCYPSLEASMTTTITMFVDNVLTKATVVGRKNFSKIYIHPVLPVLKETKHLVKPYNATYKAKIDAASKISKHISWLDCLSDITSVGDEYPRVFKDYELDDTHIHPKYIEHIKNAINKV